MRKKLPLLSSSIRWTGPQDSAYFLVALDNDRALEHPSHEARRHSNGESCPHCALLETIHERMPDGWPIPGAIAVPVQMIEAWLLLIHDPAKHPNESTLPVCARRDQEAARRIYGPDPGPQLKDLVDAAWRASDHRTKDAFALDCVLRLKPDDLAARSPSFGRFRDAVSSWRAG